MFRWNSIREKVRQILVVMEVENRNSIQQINVEQYDQYPLDRKHSLNIENILQARKEDFLF